MNLRDLIQSHLREIGANGLVNTDKACGCDIDDLQPCASDCMRCIPAKRVIATEDGDCHDAGDAIYVPIGQAHLYVEAPPER